MADGITAKLSHDARILSIDGEGKYQSAEIDYIVKFDQVSDSGTLEEKAIAAVRELAASKLHGVPLKSISIKERLAPNAFTVTVNYSGENEDSESGGGGGGGGSGDDDGEAEMTFECSAESKHVEIAYSQRILASENDEYDTMTSNIIGWNGKRGDDYAATGCDTPTGVAVETWSKRMKYENITTEKKMRWAETVGCVNSAFWKGWPARCAMFMGASFSKNTDDTHVLVSFHFRVGSPKETFTLNGEKIEVEKSPFDYVWADVTTPKNELPKTKAIIAAVVAPEADFDVLGI